MWRTTLLLGLTLMATAWTALPGGCASKQHVAPDDRAHTEATQGQADPLAAFMAANDQGEDVWQDDAGVRDVSGRSTRSSSSSNASDADQAISSSAASTRAMLDRVRQLADRQAQAVEQAADPTPRSHRSSPGHSGSASDSIPQVRWIGQGESAPAISRTAAATQADSANASRTQVTQAPGSVAAGASSSVSSAASSSATDASHHRAADRTADRTAVAAKGTGTRSAPAASRTPSTPAPAQNPSIAALPSPNASRAPAWLHAIETIRQQTSPNREPMIARTRRHRSGDARPDQRSPADRLLARAMRIAAISAAASPQSSLDPMDLVHLGVEQRQQVRQFHQWLIDSLHGDDPSTAIESVVNLQSRDALDSFSASQAQPVQITTAELCTRVQSFGVYEPFETTRFASGQVNRMIVYLELDHFHSRRNSQGQFEVQLAQELELYNETDGLVVWHEPRVDMTDRSRNERRDFFVVQMIELPKTLSVGKYRLKVRVTDLIGGSLDEAVIPIEIVADHRLVHHSRQ